MSKPISLSIDELTEKKFDELQDILQKSKSRMFKDFVNFFYQNKDKLSSGINIITSIPTSKVNSNNTTEAIQE